MWKNKNVEKNWTKKLADIILMDIKHVSSNNDRRVSW